jgi:carbon-monoxide dehydrogenase iron sulfur subunit
MPITLKQERCVGCRLCELACSFARYGHFDPHQAAIRVTFADDGGLQVSISAACADCQRPLCVAYCPTGAIAGDLSG